MTTYSDSYFWNYNPCSHFNSEKQSLLIGVDDEDNFFKKFLSQLEHSLILITKNEFKIFLQLFRF